MQTPNTQQPVDAPPPTDTDWIIIPWKSREPALAYWIFAIAGFAGAIKLTLSPLQMTLPIFSYIAAAISLILALAAATRGFIMQKRQIRTNAILRNPASTDDPAEIAIIMLQRWRSQLWAGRKGFQPTKQRLTNAFKIRGWTAPKIIIDRRYADQIAGIPRTTHFLELEPIQSYPSILSYLRLLPAISITSYVLLRGIIYSLWWRFVVGLLGWIVLAYAYQWIYLTLTGRSAINDGTVGIGILEFSDGKTLRADQCITLVYQQNEMRVRLLGPADQVIDLRFANPKDPGFSTFWQRWNHPNPRPELLT